MYLHDIVVAGFLENDPHTITPPPLRNALVSVLHAALRLVRPHRVDRGGAPRHNGRRCDGPMAA
jgi:hypothetical protein